MSSPANAQRSRVRLAAASVLAGGGAAVVIPLVFAAVVLLYPTISGNNQYWIREISLIAVLTLVVSGVNLSFGYAGELQFGQVFMYALGAYIGGILSMHGHKDIVVLMVISGLAALAVGVVIAVPALRIGGWSLAMASFFLIITIPDFVALYPKWTGGLNGLIGIPAPRFAGHNLSPTGLFYATVIPTIVWLACYRNLVTSRYGTVFRILRESPILASSLAFSPRRLKVFAY
ncbi:MAG TPA: branched-chain amino acid ABC transporter permease, partial [Vicinamibacterales bacterium]|nr:branched-chain amino acid ABC transporter permease [Vicinamibacterales bacterium]